MSRSGVLLIIVSALALLTACTGPDQQPTVQEPAPPSSRSCPIGFTDALASHIATTTGDEVSVTEDTAFRFDPPELDKTVDAGCVVRIEQTIPNGTMVRVVGVTSDVTLEGVLDLLHAAGWVQPFPEAEPFAYESEVRDPGGNQNMSSVGVFAAADTDPIFGFAGWVEYFAGSAVVLQAAPSV